METKFDMIGLFVKNLNLMVAFYKDVIGVEIEWDGKGPYAEFKHDGIRFAMDERDQPTGRSTSFEGKQIISVRTDR